MTDETLDRTESYKIVDKRTGIRATVVSYFTRDQASRQIDEWVDRYHRGGRPDITLEFLSNLDIQLEAP